MTNMFFLKYIGILDFSFYQNLLKTVAQTSGTTFITILCLMGLEFCMYLFALQCPACVLKRHGSNIIAKRIRESQAVYLYIYISAKKLRCEQSHSLRLLYRLNYWRVLALNSTSNNSDQVSWEKSVSQPTCYELLYTHLNLIFFFLQKFPLV